MKQIIVFTIVIFSFLFYAGDIFASSNIVINEFYAAGGSSSSNSDWVEIYNEGMDISLYQLIDADNHKKDLSGAICNGHFCTIDWYNLLNKDGDIITLTSKLYPDTPIDQVKYGNFGGISAPNTGQSAGRNPDGTGNWTIFSTPSKGSTNNTSPIPTSTSTPTSIPTPLPTSTPISSPTQKPTSSFTITPSQIQINSDQSFLVAVNLSLSNKPNTKFYLKGVFNKPGSTNYFGKTLVSNNWIKNSDTYSNQHPITTNSSGEWSGSLEIKPDIDDSGYTGSDDYTFKVGGYDSTDSSPSVSWSNNESTIKIISTENDNSGSTSISTSNNSPSATNPPSSLPSVKTTATTSTTPLQPKNYDRLVYHIASVAGATASASTSAATLSSKVSVKNDKQINPLFWIGLIFIFAGVGSIGYIYLKKNAKIHI